MREALSFGLVLVLFAGCAQQEGEILFSSSRDGIQDVYVMDADGSNVRRLTFTTGELGSGHSSMPTWSPSGEFIAFSSDRQLDNAANDIKGETDVFLMNPDGSEIRRLTRDPAYDGQPDFSPDGERLAFVSTRDGNPEIYTISLDGKLLQRLTDWRGWDEFPDWHPDGSRILFESEGRDGFDGLFVMDSNGENVQHIINGHRGRWSPDGNRIAFAARDCEVGSTEAGFDGNPLPLDRVQERCSLEEARPYGVFVLDIRTGALDRVFPPPVGSAELPSPDGLSYSTVSGGVEPVWSPDGDKILFHWERLGPDTEPFREICCPGVEIFMINADGSDLRALTWNVYFDGHMRWW
jgi:Tol biopolymer transport system component